MMQFTRSANAPQDQTDKPLRLGQRHSICTVVTATLNADPATDIRNALSAQVAVVS